MMVLQSVYTPVQDIEKALNFPKKLDYTMYFKYLTLFAGISTLIVITLIGINQFGRTTLSQTYIEIDTDVTLLTETSAKEDTDVTLLTETSAKEDTDVTLLTETFNQSFTKNSAVSDLNEEEIFNTLQEIIGQDTADTDYPEQLETLKDIVISNKTVIIDGPNGSIVITN